MSKNLTTGIAPKLNGAGQRIVLVCARWNDLIVNRLENGARQELLNAGVAEGDITSIKVPGALEIPIAIKAALATGAFDAAIALGVVLRGDTYHFEVVSNESASGIMRVGLDSGRVVTNGILTVETEAQADERSVEGPGNKGAEAAAAALELLAVFEQLVDK
ncbi:MAG TPA: 6,7-dimethyl-8-ribityllumazine synthase [Acidimicrobiaceae bacterium]|nr:6,7-dimethyl-8-ribityllumazine synthase [Acidimicrobiaceae bacterium]